MAQKNKRPTQADVARRANVSQAMVSYILNGNSAVSVPPETRQRILAAMQELGYIPNITARSLRTSKTYTIASIIPDITNPFYPAFQRGIQDVAEHLGYDLIMYNTDGVAEKEWKCLRSAQQGRVDGVIGAFFHLTAQDLFPLLDRGIAIVRLEAMLKQAGVYPLDNLYVDNIAAAQMAVSYLIKQGHRRIGLIAEQRGPGHLRTLGYQQALAAHKLPFDKNLLRSGNFAEEGGYQAMQELLALSSRPSAVFAVNDMMAIGSLRAIREAGLSVPDDVAVMGFDDIPIAKLVYPPLTTVAQHQEQLGRRAAAMLMERLSGAAPETGRCEEMPFQLVIRESA
ncbi:MAG TPA: LacI family DNA-binding transcriptional regulator [Anaerolineae bacterium]|nr:LacI family DNA-binding transcriptional regulator [Anaerolineae bacterium]